MLVSNAGDHIVYLTWKQNGGDWELHRQSFEVSPAQVEVATIQVAKVYVQSLNLLWFFMIQYHEDKAHEFRQRASAEVFACAERVRSFGLESEGLTDI